MAHDTVPPAPYHFLHPAIVHTFDPACRSDGERVSRARSEGSLAAVLRAPAVGLAAVRAVPVHPKLAPAAAARTPGDLVQAGLPHDGLPAAGHHLAVTRAAAQQHLHRPTVGDRRGPVPNFSRSPLRRPGSSRRRSPQLTCLLRGPGVGGLRLRLLHLHVTVASGLSGGLADRASLAPGGASHRGAIGRLWKTCRLWETP